MHQKQNTAITTVAYVHIGYVCAGLLWCNTPLPISEHYTASLCKNMNINQLLFELL